MLLFAGVLLATPVAFASSGESETVYAGEGKYRATRPLWANAYAPNDEIHNEDGVNDLGFRLVVSLATSES